MLVRRGVFGVDFAVSDPDAEQKPWWIHLLRELPADRSARRCRILSVARSTLPNRTVGRIRMTIDRLAGVRDREDRPTDHTQPAGGQR